MKIIKLNQSNKLNDPTFEDEGNTPEDNTKLINEKQNFEKQQEFSEFENSTTGKSRTISTSEIINNIKKTKPIGDMLEASWVANGSVAWFKYNNVIYEILVSPAAYGYYFQYFQDLLKRKEK